MEHPTPEDWMDYLYGEVGRRERRQMDAHVRDCAECREAVAGWRATMGRLDEWRLPQRRPIQLAGRVLRIAAAVLVVLGIGYGVGRLAAPRVDVEALRADVEASVGAALREELGAQMEQVAARAVTESNADMLAILEAQARGHGALVASLRQEERRRMARDAILQNDIATLVELTENEFIQTRQDVATVLAWRSPAPAWEAAPVDAGTSTERGQQ
jgi:hypothetical protein